MRVCRLIPDQTLRNRPAGLSSPSVTAKSSGAKSWFKIIELRRLTGSFGRRLIQNLKGHCEENAHLERSHRTDDDEFYILLQEVFGYIYYYNNVRGRSALDYQTPFGYLKSQLPDLDDDIRYAVPVILDAASVKLGLWSGYSMSAQNQKKRHPRSLTCR
jgi:hypothetical protein